METEETRQLTVHYATFRKFLASFMALGGADKVSAKDRLRQLPSDQFLDVATDLADEINRRLKDSLDTPFLPVRINLPAKRNQARQKMATLPDNRFKELAMALFQEIEARHPQIRDRYEKNNVRRNDASSVRARGDSSRTGNESSSERSPVSRERRDRIKPTASDRSEQADQSKSTAKEMAAIQLQLDEALQRNENLTRQIEKLKEENTYIQDDYEEQLKNNQSIKEEAGLLLEDVRKLNDVNNEISEDRDALRFKCEKLQADLIMSRKETVDARNSVQLAQSLQQSKEYKSPVPTSSSNKKFAAPLLMSRKDRIEDNSFYVSYQQASTQLLQTAKKGSSTGVLAPMKAIIVACKALTEDSDRVAEGLRPKDSDSLKEAKETLSDELSGLMSLAKQHASRGDSAVAIGDQLFKMQNCVIDLIERVAAVKAQVIINTIKVGTPDTLKDNQSPILMKSPTKDPPPMALEDLRYYLEDMADDISKVIQELLQAMRSDTDGSSAESLINEVSQIADNIVFETRSTIDITPSLSRDRRKECETVMQLLEDERERILRMTGLELDGRDRKKKPEIASCAYEIAKHAKDLLAAID